MSSPPDPDLKQYVDHWRKVGPELERLRRVEVMLVDTRRAIESLDGIVAFARGKIRPLPTSGLVEQQRLFQLLGR